ncbi:MAG: hypothetical protein LUB63_02580 [Oscillospiraceae bacterium]|nr:hypothetical protein [Oscillospiraceae bacterium]
MAHLAGFMRHCTGEGNISKYPTYARHIKNTILCKTEKGASQLFELIEDALFYFKNRV